MTTPNDYNSQFKVVGIKTPTGSGTLDGSTYSTLVGIRGWSDNSGGNSHELAFTGSGSLYRRHGSTTSWSDWIQILDSSNYTSYCAKASHTHSYLPLSGGTLTGDVTMSSDKCIKSDHVGSSYYKARDTALIVHTTSTQVSSYSPIYSLKGISGDFSGGLIHYASGESQMQWIYVLDTNYSSSTNTYTSLMTLTNAGKLTATQVYGAVWNDYAEYRSTVPDAKPGQVVIENGDGTLRLSTERLQPGCEVISDTFGFAIGKTDECKTPIAATGRVLVYTYEDRNSYLPGDAVCSAPEGKISKMTREEIINYPERIIGTVSEIPTYERWGSGNVEVDGRIWIRIR